MDKANGLCAAVTEDNPSSTPLFTPNAANPTPAELAALLERLRELGHPRATIANLAGKLGVKRPTLIRWINKGQPFPPEAIEAARAWESNLQAEIERWEAESGNEPAPETESADAPPEPQDGPGGASEGDDKAEGGQAAGEAPEAPEGAQGAAASPPPENNTGDADAEWERRRRQFTSVDDIDEPEDKTVPDLEFFNVGDETGDIEPREWLLGISFCRGYLSGLTSAGAAGKTTIRLLQLLSLAANRKLSGEHVFVRARCLVVCLEDDLEELRRRVRAMMLHHKVSAKDVDGWLVLTTPKKLKIAELDKRGRVTEGGLLRALVKAVDERKFDVVCIDPAVKAHTLEENNNTQMDSFSTMLADFAQEKRIAVDLLSHERKAGAGANAAVAGDPNRNRGASSVKDAQRLAKTLTGMTEGEAVLLNVSEADRPSLVRVDNAKVNIAPPSRKATWFKIVSVNLGNGTPTYPNGDNVQAAECWEPTPLMVGLDIAGLNAVLKKFDDGMDDGRRYSLDPRSTDRAAWKAVQGQFPDLNDVRCKEILKGWKKKGMFTEGKYDDPVTRKPGVTGILSAKQIEVAEDPY